MLRGALPGARGAAWGSAGRGLSATAALLLLGCGGEPAVDTARARGAVNGSEDSSEQYSMVVGLVTKKGQYLSRCSGALIAQNLVLTARHCVSPSSGGLVSCGQSPLGDAYPPADSLITQKYVQSDLPEDYVKVARIELAPGGDDTCGFDLAAVVLSGDGLGSGAATTIPRIDLPVQVGELHTAVGYGSTGSGGVGTRRYKTDVAVSCVGTLCDPLPAQDSEWVSDDDAFCQSDSGAAALDAEGRLTGIVSRGVSPCGTPILASVAAWKTWLVQLGAAAALEGGYETPFWAKSGTSTPPADAGSDAPLDAGSDVGAPAPAPSTPRDKGGCGVRPGSSTENHWLVALAATACLCWARRRRNRL